MVQFKGFVTKKEAEECVKKEGGAMYTQKEDNYEMCVVLGGLDARKYPYCVIWRDK